jgi:hypothetical protein
MKYSTESGELLYKCPGCGKIEKAKPENTLMFSETLHETSQKETIEMIRTAPYNNTLLDVTNNVFNEANPNLSRDHKNCKGKFRAKLLTPYKIYIVCDVCGLSSPLEKVPFS